MYKNYSELGVQESSSSFSSGGGGQEKQEKNVLEIMSEQQRMQILAQNRVVCIDIYADWCGPCKKTAPAYATIANNYSRPGECAVVKYNLDNIPAEKKQMINGIPLFQFYVDRKMVDTVIGADMAKIEEKLQMYIGQKRDNGTNASGPIYNKNSIRSYRTPDPNTSTPAQRPSGNPNKSDSPYANLN